MTTRRHFVAGLLAASAAPRLSWADAGDPAYLAAAREADGGFALFGLDGDGRDLFRVALPGRGHAAAAHPLAPEAVAFARRPGRFALVIDCVSGGVIERLEAPDGRHFYGHGAFAAGGDILCTTENAYETGAGRIGLWSRRRGYARIGEIASGGTGPHEIIALEDELLAVANGGIRTHPDRGRDKLNLDSMAPSLAYLSLDGVVDEMRLPPDLARNSIRHLARGPGGVVGFAMQWQGDPMAPVPLAGLHRRGAAPVLAEADLAAQLAMQGYAGSIAFDGGGRLGITSPRGGRLHLFGPDGRFERELLRPDICGLARGGGGFVATDGHGALMRIGRGGAEVLRRTRRAWDNHLVAL